MARTVSIDREFIENNREAFSDLNDIIREANGPNSDIEMAPIAWNLILSDEGEKLVRSKSKRLAALILKP